MSEIEVRHIAEDDWTRLAAGFHDYNYKQFWSYGLVSAAAIGASSEFIGFYKAEFLLGITNIRLKKIPLLPTGIAYINGGPIFMASEDVLDAPSLLRECLQALVDEYVVRRHFVLRIKCTVYPEPLNIDLSRVFEELNFRPAQNSDLYRTFLVDISKPVEDIRKALHGKWRNQLNRGEKNELTVVRGTDISFFQQFESLFTQLKTRKGFDVSQDVGFFEKVQEGLQEKDKFFIQLASKDGDLLSAHVGSYIGDTAVYLLGASSHDGNALKASYILQWNTILTARERGCKWYDLGGIDPDGNQGVYHFKKGFNGTDVTAAGPFEIGPPVFSILVRWLEKGYALLRRLKARS